MDIRNCSESDFDGINLKLYRILRKGYDVTMGRARALLAGRSDQDRWLAMAHDIAGTGGLIGNVTDAWEKEGFK